MRERTTAAARVSESADSTAMLDPDYALLPSWYSGSGRPRTEVALCYYNILTGQGDQILNSHVDISHPLCIVRYPDALN